ncbi:MAG TPA: immunoglobulin domain-containing protein [Verrucomicrobiae bacterium]|jgi:autotransporter-associated beta strand protein
MKITSSQQRTRLFLKHLMMCALVALVTPLAAPAQQTVFNDTFGTSSLNQTNITGGIPGGTPTVSQTSYTCASAKAAPSFSISPGLLQIYCPSTSSANSEVQALFTKYPVTLASVGDYIELTYTFTDETNQMNNVGGNGSGFHMGLYNSGGVAPQSGGTLQNGGVGSATTAYIGGTSNWVGFAAQMVFSQTAGSAWGLFTRPVQPIAQNSDQELLYNYTHPSGATLASTSPTTFPTPNLTIGSQYTGQLRITLSAANTLTISNALYTGVGTSGTILFSNVANTVTGANVMTTNFDGLAFGFRATGGGVAWTNNITDITVVAGLAAQAGPYFFVTTSGTGCNGSIIGLSGSVTTNSYLLYTNNVYTGQSLAGTGSPLSFGLETNSGIYTIEATNTIGESGPMLGSAIVSIGVPIFTTEPSSVTCVTNVTATFSVAASGNPAAYTYQWYLNGNALTNGGDDSGVTTTNLVIAPTQAGDAGAYYIVMTDPCGDSITSAPNATLTLIPASTLVWQGNNGATWDFSSMNFTNLSGATSLFTNGDNALFDNTSGNTTVTIDTNNVTPTLITVNSSQAYTFTGNGQLSGVGALVDAGSGVLTIGNNNTFIGGTTVNNGATLTLGTGTGTAGELGGIINVSPSAILNYNYGSATITGADPIENGFAGSGTINFNETGGATIVTASGLVSSNFNGTINIQGSTSLHASAGNPGDPFGYGSTVYVPSGAQLYLDNTTVPYNMTVYLNGTGWADQTPPPYTGALRIYNSTFTGSIILQSDSRIGGTINGATVQAVISGSHQLEIYGNTNSFVLVLGPTNGSPQGYSSTLITSGAIGCANTNAVSTGSLTEDAGGDFQLNGNNITVADLSSIDDSGNIGYPTWMAGPTVRNNNATNAAVLTVGGDNTYQEYDGTFLDGAAASLGLTKVGSGTLTLTALNTNSGPVTVSGGTLALTTGGPIYTSGAFTRASLLAVGSGANLSDSSTLTLNSGQRLAGNGTVSANVVISSGATLNPGLPMGTLTVSGGSVTMNSGSTYLVNLNRAGSPNYSKLSDSSGITYAGTLAVTNVGAALQVGDTFSVVSPTSAFTAYNLETTDTVNQVVYTWTTNIVGAGQVIVASVTPIVTVNPNPTNIVFSVSGGSLSLSWPADHTGWTLQSQTNAPGVGLTATWYNVSGSSATDMVTVPFSPTNGSVFYRLEY